MKKTTANTILDLHTLWSETDKQTLNQNINKVVIREYPDHYENQTQIVRKVCELLPDTKESAVTAWFNKGREDVKIPFLKLCELASVLKVDVQILLDKKTATDIMV